MRSILFIRFVFNYIYLIIIRFIFNYIYLIISISFVLIIQKNNWRTLLFYKREIDSNYNLRLINFRATYMYEYKYRD